MIFCRSSNGCEFVCVESVAWMAVKCKAGKENKINDDRKTDRRTFMDV